MFQISYSSVCKVLVKGGKKVPLPINIWRHTKVSLLEVTRAMTKTRFRVKFETSNSCNVINGWTLNCEHILSVASYIPDCIFMAAYYMNKGTNKWIVIIIKYYYELNNNKKYKLLCVCFITPVFFIYVTS